jgi:hypothetical protein
MITPSFQRADDQTRVAGATDTTIPGYKKPFLKVEI